MNFTRLVEAKLLHLRNGNVNTSQRSIDTIP